MSSAALYALVMGTEAVVIVVTTLIVVFRLSAQRSLIKERTRFADWLAERRS